MKINNLQIVHTPFKERGMEPFLTKNGTARSGTRTEGLKEINENETI